MKNEVGCRDVDLNKTNLLKLRGDLLKILSHQVHSIFGYFRQQIS
jgi:hypothetical protein